jgi:AbrB family transcriptional regulator (stage V sporulation protein T)
MKATGVVRRIDELGRIVIPKEVRKTFRIKEGTPLELYIGDNEEIILKKYSPILELSYFATEIAESIFNVLSTPVVVVDSDKVVAVVGHNKNLVLGKPITFYLEKLIEKRNITVLNKSESVVQPLYDGDTNQNSFAVAPIVANSETCGAIIIFAKDNTIINEIDLSVLKSLCLFLSKQID